MSSINSILDFIRDWLPSLSIIIGGIWVFFNWITMEKQKANKEVPALEGTISVSSIELGKEKTILTVEGIWNNKSPYHVNIDVNLSKIMIYAMSTDQSIGHINTLDLEKPLYKTRLFRNYSNYKFEPNVAWKIQEHYVLETGKIYLIHWLLVLDTGKTKSKKLDTTTTVWESSVMCDCRQLETNKQH
ncbi:MAG: hypothetical protein J0M11_06510 [Anaerolineae bacterium]|nr:hypothetical protein [Anaerolineae bacterium]